MAASNLLEHQEHRLWPLPSRPWVMAQTWENLLFAHWPLAPAALRGFIPPGLELDTYAGEAWVGVVPFSMSGIHLRGLPPIPGFSALPELNVRTYVTRDDKPGVLFFSLDAGNLAAVIAARYGFALPYYYARMQQHGEEYLSRRFHWGARAAEFVAHYWPSGDVFRAQAGSLEYWLTERYCLYTADRRGTLYRGDIHHRPWPLQAAQATIFTNTMAEAQGISLPDIPPLLHFARRLDVLIWSLEPLDA